MDELLKIHGASHNEVTEKCPFCNLRRIADSLELISMVVARQVMDKIPAEADEGVTH